jgi:hypothetical protein
MRAFVIAAVVAAAGCKGGKSAAECKTETDALVKLLREADHSPMLPWQISLDVQADGVKHRGAPIELDAIGAALIKGEGELPMRLQREFGTGVVVIHVDDAVPWSRVVELADKLAASRFDHPIFYVPRAPTSKPPPRTPTDDDLDKILAASPSEQASALAKMASTIVEPCKPLKKVFGAVGADANEDKAEMILLGTSEALPECGCNVDMGALRSVMYRVFEDPHPADARRLVLKKGGKPVALPAATPWKDASKQLPEGETIWLVAN